MGSSSSCDRPGDTPRLILSLFPGIGLLDRAFEECGFCVVRGPDILWGGDIRQFHPPAGVFWGVIGGPPCQDFSGLRRTAPTGYGLEMLAEFARCVTEASPEWWLMENVARVPNVTTLHGHIFAELGHNYIIQRFDINEAWYCDVTRLRHIQFGSRSGRLLNVTRRSQKHATQGAALASDNRPFEELCRLQGLPDGFDLPPFLASEKKRAVGNGVPLPMGRALAQAVIEAYNSPAILQRDLAGLVTPTKVCKCGCGRPVVGKAKYSSFTCRKRAQRKRDTARSQFEQSVTRRQVTEP
jgi:DNA (cytosine-5)-methyltransferase 1